MTDPTQTTSKSSRRRGEVLERALFEATLAELGAVGYSGLTMEGIAARAQTGKAALYRRWSNKHDLVRAALLHVVPPLPEARAGKSLRENLLTVLTSHCDILAGKTAFPSMNIMSQLIHEPEIRTIFADAVMGPRTRIIESILRAGERHGDIEPGILTPLSARVGPALINQHFLFASAPPNQRELALIVDTVLGSRRRPRARN